MIQRNRPAYAQVTIVEESMQMNDCQMCSPLRALAPLVVIIAFTHVSNADDKDEIKALIPAAAAIEKADLKKIAQSAIEPQVNDFKNQSLSLLLLIKYMSAADTDENKAEFEILAERVPPAVMAEEIDGDPFDGPATFIPASRITDITCDVVGGRATGVVKFKVPKLYQGQANYVAMRSRDGWQVTELSMPAHKIRVVRKGSLWEEKR